MKKSQYILIILIGLVIAAVPVFLNADEYDYYVDESVSKSGDGSESNPFKTISEALEKKGRIFVEDWKYEEDLKILKGTSLLGESENGVIISGKITMEDDTFLSDVTARGGRTVITVEEDADVEIKNCTVEDFEGIGIETLAGGGKLKVTDSKIKNASGKGFYIQRGKTIEISGSEVEGVDEEGIDLRSKISGVIIGNNISNNGESGIELIVGSADLKIENNILKRNGSSGIATQFYPDSGLDGKGEIRIDDNSIGYNNNYGLDCKRPQGGSPEKGYWKDSIELEGNDIHNNQKGAINDYCRMAGAVDEDEESDNIITENKNEIEKREKEEEGAGLEPELTPEEKERIKLEEVKEREREQKLNKIKELLETQSLINAEMEKNFIVSKKESKIKKFFFGPEKETINDLNSKLNLKQNQLDRANQLINEISLDPEEKVTFQKSIEEEQQIIKQNKEMIASENNAFSLFGWIKNIFRGLF